MSSRNLAELGPQGLEKLNIRDPGLQRVMFANSSACGSGSQIVRFLARLGLEKSNVWDDG